MNFGNSKKKIYLIVCLIVLSEIFTNIFASGVNRYAIYVGSNKGGKDRTELLYAGTDAENLRKTMSEIGGISEKNSLMLLNPSQKDINSAIKTIADKIESNKNDVSRTEFLFYYSGHSDEDALLLGDQKYAYSDLKADISNVPSDIHVVILDSCYSGNFIRTKGGQKKKPFLVDDSSVVKGHAYLSSSSDTESSQESDEIEASYFTSSIVTGLRGAADSSGDKKVTLTELYSYAFNETLKKTEDSASGPQHPNYNITLVGSGDLILSDFSASDSIVSIGKDVVGKVVLRNSEGRLISEIDKTEAVPVLLALPEGSYKLLLIQEKETLQGNFEVRKDEAFVIENSQLTKVDTKENAVRGNQNRTESNEEKSAEDNSLLKINWNSEKSDSDSGNIKKSSFNLELGYLSTPFPFDIFLGFNCFSKNLGGIGYYGNLFKTASEVSTDLNALDYSLRFSTFTFPGNLWTLFCGIDCSYMRVTDSYSGNSISPSAEIIHTGSGVCRGAYCSVNPVVFTIFSDDYKSYWNWIGTMEIGAVIPFSNFYFSPFMKASLESKIKSAESKAEVNYDVMLGLTIGLYVPSKKYSKFYKN